MEMKVTLVHDLLELKNPVLNAAGTFGYGLEFKPYGNITQLGAIVTNGITLNPSVGFSMPRIHPIIGGMLSAVGTQNDGADHFVNEILPRMPWGDVPIIVNVNASTVDEFSELASKISRERGVTALEINLTCRNSRRNGQRFSDNPVTAARAVKYVKNASGGRPVIAKLALGNMDIVEVARAVEAAGADVITCIGMPEGLAVDLNSRTSSLGHFIGGVSGPAIKPLAMKAVWSIAQVVRIPIIACGGVTSARDVLEFILAGAHAVQVGTANFTDPQTIFRIIKELPSECEAFHIESWKELRGSLKK